MNYIYDMKTLLEIIFKYTKKNARTLADRYLLKDVSIISKWRNNVTYPKNDDIIRIVEFVDKEATLSQKELIRDNIEELLENAPIKSRIKDIVLNTENFSEFLKEAINVSMSDYEEKNILYCPEKEKRTRHIAKKEPQTKRRESYSGTVELDFILPEGSDASFQKLAAGSEIEFQGKLNLSPKKETIKVAKFLKSITALGLLLIWVISGVLIAFSVDISKINPFAYASKKDNAYSETTVLESDLNTLENHQGYSERDKNNDVHGLPDMEEQIKTEVENKEDLISEREPDASHALTSQDETKEINSPAKTRQEEDKQKEEEAVDNETNNTSETLGQTITNAVVNSSRETSTNNTEINSWNNFNIQISGENLSLIVGEQNAVSIEAE